MQKLLLSSLFGCLLFQISFAQKNKTADKVCIAFYNCENFYDTINDPKVSDEEFLPDAKTHWNTEKYNTKKNHLAQVISSMNNGKAADAIGLSEVENKNVLEDLIAEPALKKLNYGIVHYNSPDERGIDVAFLYKKSALKILSSKIYGIHFPFDSSLKTRDILVVKVEFNNKETAYIFVNHFPSRRNGTETSEPKRMFVAQIEKQIIDSIESADKTAKVIAMGDFNDTPSDKSIQALLSSSAHFTNPFEKFEKEKTGTIYYKGEWSVFDQILLSQNLMSAEAASKISYENESATLFKPDFVLEQTPGKYFGSPNRTFAGMKYLGGYSDHISVNILLDLKK